MFDYFTDFFIEKQRGVTFILTSILLSFFIVVLLSPKSKTIKGYILHYFVDFPILWILMTFVECLCQFLFGNSYDIFIIVPVATLAYGLIRNYKQWLKHPKFLTIIFIYSAIYYAIVLSSLTISEAAGSYIRESVTGSNTPVTFIIQLLVLALPSIYMKTRKIKSYNDIPLYCSAMTFIITILHIITYYFGRTIATDFKYFFSMINAFFILIEIASFTIYTVVIKEHIENLNYQAVTMKDEISYELVQMGKAENEKLRKIRHDMKNHMAYLNILLEEGKYEELKEYFKQYSSEFYDAVGFSHCGNSTVDYILNIESQKAGNSGVEIESKIGIAPVLPIEDKDLCAVLMNVIDNAIEAACKNENKKISVSMRQEDENILIRVINSITGQQIEAFNKHKFETTKEEKVGHGYGVKIVKETVKKYNGAFNYQIKDNLFIVDCMMSTYKGGNE